MDELIDFVNWHTNHAIRRIIPTKSLDKKIEIALNVIDSLEIDVKNEIVECSPYEKMLMLDALASSTKRLIAAAVKNTTKEATA